MNLLFGFALTTAYWPGIAGVATTPRWDVAALLAVVFFCGTCVRMTAAHWLGLALIGWLFLSLSWSEGQPDGIDAAFKIGLAGIAFAVGSNLKDIRSLWIGSASGIGVSSVISIYQAMGWWNGLVTEGVVSGLFYNPDRLAAAAAIVALGLLTVGRWYSALLLPLLAPSLILTGSRAAWVAVVTGVLTVPTRWPIAMWFVRAAALCSGSLYLAIRGNDASIGERVALYRDTAAALTTFGHGLGSFRESFMNHAHFFDIAVTHSRPEHPHNEWLWIAYEGGIPAFALAMAFAAAVWRRSVDMPERAVLAGLFVLSMFAMPFHDPATLILGALCAGYIAGDRARYGVESLDGGLALQPRVASGIGRRRAF
jgi:O-antigen ligase